MSKRCLIGVLAVLTSPLAYGAIVIVEMRQISSEDHGGGPFFAIGLGLTMKEAEHNALHQFSNCELVAPGDSCQIAHEEICIGWYAVAFSDQEEKGRRYTSANFCAATRENAVRNAIHECKELEHHHCEAVISGFDDGRSHSPGNLGQCGQVISEYSSGATWDENCETDPLPQCKKIGVKLSGSQCEIDKGEFKNDFRKLFTNGWIRSSYCKVGLGDSCLTREWRKAVEECMRKHHGCTYW